MLYTRKPFPVEATQWFKNGDHPEDYVDVPSLRWKPGMQGVESEEFVTSPGDKATFVDSDGEVNLREGTVVRYFRSPDVSGESVCELCGNTFHVHGFIDSHRSEDGEPQTVCPGMYVVKDDESNTYYTQDRMYFESNYIPYVTGSNVVLW